MNFNSPKYYKGNRQYRNSEELRSPFPSPQNYSPSFSPYSYSSPQNYRGPRRYFNNSNASTNSSSSNGSPYNHYNRRNRDNYRHSTDSSNMSLYYDPSCLENPWAELEKELEEKKQKKSLEQEKE